MEIKNDTNLGVGGLRVEWKQSGSLENAVTADSLQRPDRCFVSRGGSSPSGRGMLEPHIEEL